MEVYLDAILPLSISGINLAPKPFERFFLAAIPAVARRALCKPGKGILSHFC